MANLGGIDACVKDTIDKNLIPLSGTFYKQFTAGVRYLMVGYRYENGKYGLILLYNFKKEADVRYALYNGTFSKIS